MIAIVAASVATLPFVTQTDPAPGLTRSKAASRHMECERMTAEVASRRYPGVIVPPKPRGDYVERSVLVCSQRVLREGLRRPQDEAVLSTLASTASELASATEAVPASLASRTWLVEAFYPSAPVAAKLSFATKDALVQLGRSVSDRTPTLSAGDLDVITRLPPRESYPAACRRYFETGAMDDGDALLAIVNLDPRETALHAGLCASGAWTWVR